MEYRHRMTATRFDASASVTPPYHIPLPQYARFEGVAFRIVRLVWLTALLTRRQSVTIADYQRRFGTSLRSFRRDITLLRRAGFYIDADGEGGYRMLSFLTDADHA